MTFGYRMRIGFAIALAAVLSWTAASAQPQWRWPQSSRVVVVPDIHGAYSELVALLQATRLVDADLDWTGGDATLVSLGDMIDRGPESRRVLDLLMRLQHDAPARGGAVHVLLGNHELMNLMGDLRYVTSSDYAAFAEEEPESLRDAAYRSFLAARASDADDARAEFDRLYPPGFFARELAFRPDGRYGAWLLTLPALIVIGDTAFVHGGLPPGVANAGAAEVNRKIGEDLRRYLTARGRLAEANVLPPWDRRRDEELARAARASERASAEPELAAWLDELLALGAVPELGLEGPLWYRGTAYCNPLLEEPVLAAALERLDAARVIVGHTPTQDRRPRALYDGRLVMLDTGMLTAYYSGRPAALVIEGDRTSVQTVAPEEQHAVEPGGIEAYGLTEAQILDALSEGEVGAPGDASAGEAAPVAVQFRGAIVKALVYRQGRGDTAARELAAYRLDRLMGWHLVPPTVEREIEGQPVALQLVYPDGITETQRLARNVPLAPWCPVAPQADLMRTFDALLANTGRTGDDVIFRPEYSLLKLVGHERAFGAERRLRVRGEPPSVPPALRSALASLDENEVRRTIGEWIGPKQIDALLDRRDALLRRDTAR